MKKLLVGLLVMLSIVLVNGNMNNDQIGADEIPEPRTIIVVKNT